MGARRSGYGGSRGNAGVLKERANMSFMLVVMFFAVFGVIVLTEIFLIDERRTSVGGTGALGGHRNGHRLAAAPDRPDYEEVGVSHEFLFFSTVSICFYLLHFTPVLFTLMRRICIYIYIFKFICD